ncbi:MAG: ADP-ribosylglycohydrolase family protein [Verrucomicrobiaceae bacterium]|nr:MAG: ADP-ribosylglycohydrolase family protein [Verrucomicrobiaceae bacterium]
MKRTECARPNNPAIQSFRPPPVTGRRLSFLAPSNRVAFHGRRSILRDSMSTPSDIVLGSFIGDALALGPHWIYDQSQIREKLGHVTSYQAPATTYHAGKVAGDQTHYGDQTLLLLRSIAEAGNFKLERFASLWRDFWENTNTISYRDGATKGTLTNLKAGADPEAAASSLGDLAGAARIAPLFLLNWESEEQLLFAVRQETAFTHGSPEVIETAAFFTHVVLAIRQGDGIPQALEKAAALTWKHLPDYWLEQARESAASGEKDAAALQDHGLTCNIADAFPSVCHLLLRHPQDPATALIENVNAGGDSAARGMILGMTYGAAFPVSTWPGEWLSGLNARAEIEKLMAQIH